MRNKEKDAKEMAKKRSDFLKKSYKLFIKKNIDTVSMLEIAKVCGYGTTTLYRYYSSKPKLVVAVAAWRWDQFRKDFRKRKVIEGFETMTAAQIFEAYLEAFLELYRNDKDLLRFNQMFNIYIKAENVKNEDLEPYNQIIELLEGAFHSMYIKAQKDKTIRTDVSERDMLSATLHLMLAVVTRYAVGLVYKPKEGFEEEKELNLMKDMLLREYKA